MPVVLRLSYEINNLNHLATESSSKLIEIFVHCCNILYYSLIICTWSMIISEFRSHYKRQLNEMHIVVLKGGKNFCLQNTKCKIPSEGSPESVSIILLLKYKSCQLHNYYFYFHLKFGFIHDLWILRRYFPIYSLDSVNSLPVMYTSLIFNYHKITYNLRIPSKYDQLF